MLRLLVCFICMVMIHAALPARAQILDPIDYSDQPQLLTTLPISAGHATEVVTLGRTAYVMVDDFGFTVVDWLDPNAPLSGMEVPLSGGARSLAVGNDALYVIDGFGQLEVFDLADPLVPYSLGQVSGIAEANDLCVQGDHAYLVLASGGLQVVDLTEPLAPVAGVQVALENGNQSVAVFEDRAYVLGIGSDPHSYYICVVDLSDPSQPVMSGSYGTGGTPFRYVEVHAGAEGVFVEGEFYYIDDENVEHYSNYLWPFDDTNPASPHLYEEIVEYDGSICTVPIGELIVVAAHMFGVVDPDCPQCSYNRDHLFIQEHGAPGDDRRLYDFTLPDVPRGMVWSDGHLLVTCMHAGLAIISAPMLDPDYSEELMPVCPQHAVPGMQACLFGDRLVTFENYFCQDISYEIWWNSLSVYNIVNGVPQLEHYTMGHDIIFMNSMVLFGEDLLCGDGQIFSLDDGITSLGFFGEDGRNFNLITQASGYLVGYQPMSSYQDLWLRTWNISDPEAPVLIDQWEMGTTGLRDLESHDDHVYLVRVDSIAIFRIATDGSISAVGSFALPFTPTSLASNGSLLAVGGTEGELYLYPANNIESPTPLAQLNLGKRIVDLEFGTQLYASVQEFGWAVVDVSPGNQPHVDGWIHGAEPRCAKADGDNLVLVNTCPRTTYVTRQATSSTAIAVPDQSPVVPRDFGLIRIEDAWPNPANPRISVAYELSRSATVQAEVIDLAGRRVATLAVGPRTAGRHVLQWDGRGDEGRDQASGVYMVRVHAGSESAVRKVLLAR